MCHKLFRRPDRHTVGLVTQQSTENPISVELDVPAEGIAVLRVAGEVDMLTSPTLRQRLAEAFGGGFRRVILDLDAVDFIGTSGLAALVEARSEAGRQQIDLWLACSAHRILRPLEIAGLLELFQITDAASRALGDLA